MQLIANRTMATACALLFAVSGCSMFNSSKPTPAAPSAYVVSSKKASNTSPLQQAFLFGQLQQSGQSKYQLIYENLNTHQQFGLFFSGKPDVTTVMIEPGRYRLKSWSLLNAQNQIIGGKSVDDLSHENKKSENAPFPFENEFLVELGKAYYIGKFKIVEYQQGTQKLSKIDYTLKDYADAFTNFRKNFQHLHQVETMLAYQ